MLRGRRAGRPAKGRSQKKEEPLSGVDIFEDLIAEAASLSQASASDDGRTVKKRRVGGRLVISGVPKESEEDQVQNGAIQEHVVPSQGIENQSSSIRQTIYNESEDSEDSGDADWQDVTLAAPAETGQREQDRDLQDLSLDLQADRFGLDKSPANRRKPLTAAERRLRLEVHKMHVLALLSHVHLRNHWCNDLEVQVWLNVYIRNVER